MKRVTWIVGVFAVFLAGVAHACMFDTDCDVGSNCAKRPGQIYGLCVGGLNPGNNGDGEPVYSPTDPNQTTGDTCQFSTECGPGSICLKKCGSMYGVSLRK
jgi:hypothetical protein